MIRHSGHNHRADVPVNTTPTDYVGKHVADPWWPFGQEPDDPKHRAEGPVQVEVTPGTGQCHHHRFMKDCRNTEVPVCTNEPQRESLYCRSHQH
jgi:hypothetical protein